MSDRRAPELPWTTLAFGLLAATVGTLFLLDQMDRLDARQWLHFWPVALILVGLATLAEAKWFAAAVWLGVGTVFLLPRLGYPSVDVRVLFDLTPLLITAAGGALIFQALHPVLKDEATSPGASFHAVAFMAGNHQTIASADFAGGDAVAVMGGCEIDLRGARVPSGEAVIDVTTIWGGVEIRIPEDWSVRYRMTPILASLENKTNRRADGTTRLTIRGISIMAGVEVRN